MAFAGAALVLVRVEAAEIDLGNFQADVGLDKTGDLRELAAEIGLGIFDAVGGDIWAAGDVA